MAIAIPTVDHLDDEPVSVEAYTSPKFFAAEMANVFRKSWLFVSVASEVSKPGDFIVKNFPALNASILVVRGKDNVLRAFHNVCAHRAARVVAETRGNAARFTCPYHGWGYDLAGQLKTVPAAEGFPSLDRSRCGLTPVKTGAAAGLVFIHLMEKPEQDLATFLAGIDARINEHAFNGWTNAWTFGAELPVNWKCILDNFQETYHVFHTHRITIGDRSNGPGNPMGHPLSFDFFGPHRFMDIWGNLQHAPTFIERAVGPYGSIISNGAVETRAGRATSAPKRERDPAWSMDVFGLFPHVVIDITPGILSVHETVPVAVDRTIWTTTLYYPPAQTAAQRVAQEYASAYNRDIVAEDVSLMQTLQSGMMSGATKSLRFSKIEALCRHLHHNVEQRVRESMGHGG
ncbi:MAG: aromatic ring-hydroxylating dioxygenase subunit alpha [Steroidobacteraceae bacterium]